MESQRGFSSPMRKEYAEYGPIVPGSMRTIRTDVVRSQPMLVESRLGPTQPMMCHSPEYVTETMESGRIDIMTKAEAQFLSKLVSQWMKYSNVNGNLVLDPESKIALIVLGNKFGSSFEYPK